MIGVVDQKHLEDHTVPLLGLSLFFMSLRRQEPTISGAGGRKKMLSKQSLMKSEKQADIFKMLTSLHVERKMLFLLSVVDMVKMIFMGDTSGLQAPHICAFIPSGPTPERGEGKERAWAYAPVGTLELIWQWVVSISWA